MNKASKDIFFKSVTYPCTSDRSAWCLDRGGGCALGIRSILFTPITQPKSFPTRDFKKKVALKTLQKNVKMFSNFSFFTTNLNKVEVILDAKMVFELVPRISTLWSRRRRKVTLLMARWEGGGGQSDELNKLTLRSA